MKAVIAGATGLVGRLVLQKLLSDSRVSRIVSLSRRPLPVQNAKLNTVLVQNLSQMDGHADLLCGDVYFCCLGTTIKDAGSQENFRKVDFDAVLSFGRIAKAHNACHFVLISAMGANTKSSIFYNRIKGETEEAVKALNLNSLSIFRPGLLLGDRSQSRPGEKAAALALRFLSPVLPNRLEKAMATDADFLAERMFHAGLERQKGLQILLSKDL